jgi:hypothetical protein
MLGRRLRWTVVLMLSALIVVVCAFWLAALCTPSFTPETFARLHNGMTLAEVETVLGPPGNYTTQRPRYELTEAIIKQLKNSYREEADRDVEFWQYNDVYLEIVFDNEGKVLNIQCNSMPTPNGGPLDNLFWRMKRQWRRWFPEK